MRSDKAAALVDADAQRPAQGSDVLQPHAQLAQPIAEHIVQRGLGGLVVVAHGQVVLQIAADRGVGMHHRDAVATQQVGRPHARELQQLRALHCASTQHHGAPGTGLVFHAVLAIANAHGLATFKQHPTGHGASQQPYPAAPQRRAQKGVRP